MKLYATVTSERATKGQGGNEYLKLHINTTGKEPTHRILVGETDNGITVLFQSWHFDKWRDIASDTVFLDSSEKAKGEKQKGELKHPDDCLCTDCMGDYN